MKVTEQVILDILHLYFESETSEDTNTLVEKYFSDNPEFEKKVRKEYMDKAPAEIPVSINPEQKLRDLKKTQMLLRWRTSTLLIALLGTILPLLYFTFYDFSEKNLDSIEWMFSDPGIIFAFFGIFSWIGYLIIRYRMRTTAI